MSGLLNDSPLPNEIRLKIFSLIFDVLHKVALKAFLASHWGGRSVGLGIS